MASCPGYSLLPAVRTGARPRHDGQQSVLVSRIFVYTILPDGESYLCLHVPPSWWVVSLFTRSSQLVSRIFVYTFLPAGESYLCLHVPPSWWVVSLFTRSSQLVSRIVCNETDIFSSHCGGSGFPLSLSEWSFTIFSFGLFWKLQLQHYTTYL